MASSETRDLPPTACYAEAVAGAPVPLTSFVGREREIASILGALPATRLLTLTGAGGSGKTRLALEVVVQAVASTGERATWVELARVQDPALVPEAVLAAMGVRDDSAGRAIERLATMLGEGPSLLVLDNCEHLVEACAAFADALLRQAPQLRIVATSREALGVGGEVAWLVPPLSLDAGSRDASEAVELLIQRARAVVPGFQPSASQMVVLTQICRRLDGLPLALELAAARLRVLTPEQVAERLDDRFRLLTTGNRAALPRHQTLRAAIDWSHDLLDEAEQCLLGRLSVFGGSFSLEAVEATCAGDPVDVDAILDQLFALVEKSLVQRVDGAGDARYQLLETVREYALERLVARGEEQELRRAHAELFLALARESAPEMRSPRRATWMARVHAEVDNLRGALAWSQAQDPRLHLELLGLLHWYWYGSGQWAEALHWHRRALALPRDPGFEHERATVLFSSGSFACLQARCDAARAALSEVEAIADALGDARLLADARNYLAMALNQAFDPGAQEVLLKAREWLQEHEDLYELRLNFLLHGVALMIRGEIARAVAMTEEGVRVARVFGLDRELAVALQQLAMMVLRQGDRARAAALSRESLEALLRDPQHLFLARALEFLASSAGHVEPREAARLQGAADAIRASIGADMWRVDRELHTPFREAARAAIGTEVWEQAMAEGRSSGTDAAIVAATSLAARVGEPAVEPSAHTGEWARVERPAAPARPGLAVRTLGTLEVTLDGVPIERRAWGYARARELLVYLLLHPAGRTREQVGAALWPEASASQLRNTFHVTVHHLRRTLGSPAWVTFEGDRYRLGAVAPTWLDATEYDSRMVAALRAAKRGPAPIDELRALAAAWRGDFLDGELAGDWHLEVRDRLASLHAEGLEALGSALLEARRPDDAVGVWEALVRRESTHEAAYRGLMTARARGGDRAGAVRAYRRLEAVLAREEAGPPERDTVRLLERVQQGVEV